MKRIVHLVLSVIAGTFLLTSFGGSNGKYAGGAPAGYTGSPGDGKNCTQCHNGSAANVTDWITSDIDTSGYMPDSIYNITVTVTGNGDKGFEVAPQALSGSLLGTLIAGSGSKLVGSGQYVTQTNSSNSNPKIWTFQWIAPAAGTGNVTFYGAFTVSENSTKLSTMTVEENIATSVPEFTLSGFELYPNPVIDKVHLSFSIDKGTDMKICIYDLSGHLVSKLHEGFTEKGNHSFPVDLSSATSGIYVLNLQTVNKQLTLKIIKN